MNKTFIVVLKAIALAMGVAVIVLSILHTGTTEPLVSHLRSLWLGSPWRWQDS